MILINNVTQKLWKIKINISFDLHKIDLLSEQIHKNLATKDFKNIYYGVNLLTSTTQVLLIKQINLRVINYFVKKN